MDKYRQIYEKTGKKPSALEKRPEVLPNLVEYWNGFIALDKSREWGGSGPFGIRYAEIAAYSMMFRFSDEDIIEFAHIVGKLDDVYLSWYREQNGGT